MWTGTAQSLDGPGIECRWRRFCPRLSRPAVWPSIPPCNGYRVPFPAVRRPGRGVNNPLTSSAEVKGRVELYLLSPSGPSWPVLVQTWPLPWPHIETSAHYSRYTIFRVNFWSIPKFLFLQTKPIPTCFYTATVWAVWPRPVKYFRTHKFVTEHLSLQILQIKKSNNFVSFISLVSFRNLGTRRLWHNTPPSLTAWRNMCGNA